MRHALRADHEGPERRDLSRADVRITNIGFFDQVQEPREGLHGFAQAHVVGENAAEAVAGEMRKEVEPFKLVGSQFRAESLRQRGNRLGRELGGAILEGVDEHGVWRHQRVGFRGELQGVEPVPGGAAVQEHIVNAEAQAIQRNGRRRVEIDGRLELAPAVFREADPAAAGFQKQGDLLGRERGVLHADADGEIEAIVLVLAGGGDAVAEMRAQRGAQQGSEVGGNIERDVVRQCVVPDDEFIGKGVRDVTRPRLGPAVPHEAERGKAAADDLGGGEIELEKR